MENKSFQRGWKILRSPWFPTSQFFHFMCSDVDSIKFWSSPNPSPSPLFTSPSPNPSPGQIYRVRIRVQFKFFESELFESSSNFSSPNPSVISCSNLLNLRRHAAKDLLIFSSWCWTSEENSPHFLLMVLDSWFVYNLMCLLSQCMCSIL